MKLAHDNPFFWGGGVNGVKCDGNEKRMYTSFSSMPKERDSYCFSSEILINALSSSHFGKNVLFTLFANCQTISFLQSVINLLTKCVA